ncbi:MAG: Rrf2 family transcriptional regulator [Pseudomonadota bacterium]
MELTTRGRYAVMAMVDIAKFANGNAVALRSVADRQRLSLSYLEQIFVALRRAGLVESIRGRTGGYVLSRPAQDISIAEIMAAVEERTRMTRCMAGDEISCQGRPGRCLTHDLWRALGDQIRRFLESVSLSDVVSGNTGAEAEPIAALLNGEFREAAT